MNSDTKKCPYCGGEIKAVAKKCKHCGKWLVESGEPQTVHHETTPPEHTPLQQTYNSNTPPDSDENIDTTKISIIMIVVLLGIGVICFLLVKMHDNSDYNDDYYVQDTTTVYDEYSTAQTLADTSLINNDPGVCPYDGEPDEAPNGIAAERYRAKYEQVHDADIHLMRADGKKLWYNYWTPSNESGYDDKLYIYDSETDSETSVSLNKTSMEYMRVTDMVEHDGVITIIMEENRNSNGWVDGTYVWQYFCDTGHWQPLAKGCSGAEFVNNRTVVKLDYAESINPDAPTLEQEYRYTHRTLNL